MIAPQCMLAYGSSPVKISHNAIPNEKTSTCKSHEQAHNDLIYSSSNKLFIPPFVCV